MSSDVPTQLTPGQLTDRELLLVIYTKLDDALKDVSDHEERIRSREEADADLDARVKNVEEVTGEHTKNLATLNRYMYLMLGAAAASGGVVGTVASSLIK